MDNPIGIPCIVYSMINTKTFNQSPFKLDFIVVDFCDISHISGSFIAIDLVMIDYNSQFRKKKKLGSVQTVNIINKNDYKK